MEWLEVVGRVFPRVIELVKTLFALGKSPEEVEEIVEKNITSLRDRYVQEKEEDEARLRAKHGRGEGD